MPTTQPDSDPQSSLLSAVRESQAAVLDVIRAWTDIAQQVARDLRLPIAHIDLNEAVDRAFDAAEQTLAAQRELALTVAGVVSRQIDSAVDTAVDTTAEALEGAVEERVERPQADQDDAPKAEPARQDRRPDGRTYEERSVEELRERAAELQIEGRSAMTKDELIAALRQQARYLRRNHRPQRPGPAPHPRVRLLPPPG
jgi:Rho termination factor, N-terminal domain